MAMELLKRLMHPLRDLDRLESLSPRSAARLLAHVRGCAECGRRYEARIAAERLLEGKQPSTLEKTLLGDGHLSAALRAARIEPAPGLRGAWRPLLAGVVAAGFAGIVAASLIMTPDDGFQARGVASRDLALRAFCVKEEEGAKELGGERPRCAQGAHLSFAAGAKGGSGYVALTVEGQPPETFPVAGIPGNESALPWTMKVLDQAPRVVRVRAAFAGSPDAALRALDEPRSDRVVRLEIEVGGE
jgi:hypothetical protein